MCGRYSFTKPVEAMRRLFGVRGPLPNLRARYNIAPTQEAPIVRVNRESGERELAMLRWGLVPSWSKGPDSAYQMINARAETVADKPAFRSAFRYRRCLVPADGFYEWKPQGKRKQPYRIARRDGEPFAFAGLWEHWEGGAEAIESFTIIVTDANALLRPIHDRMPVIVAPEGFDVWLRGASRAMLETLLRPYPGDDLTAVPVGPRVNSPANDDAELIEPAGAQL